jgi:phosphoadenosine phosphosulfate reductase
MNQSLQNNLNQLLHQSGGLKMVDFFQLLITEYPAAVTFSTSFSFEDQVITDVILKNNLPIEIFTLDTGRMFPETYSTWSSTNSAYQTKIKAYYPNQDTLQDFIVENGPNSFYESVENRKRCCFIRKVEPLQRALKGNKIWITGLRAAHSSDRKDLPILEWDETNQVIKYHPILHWTTDEVRQYINNNHVPYNPLQDKGFVSIGCAPCTRAIKPGEDFRAGRWWWEDADKKECGLHEHAPEPLNGND